jgi:hypothetical protein
LDRLLEQDKRITVTDATCSFIAAALGKLPYSKSLSHPAHLSGTGYSEFLRSVTDGMSQRPEATNAQMNRPFEALNRHMHYRGYGSAIVTLGGI